MKKRILLFLIFLSLTLTGCRLPVFWNNEATSNNVSQKSSKDRLPSVPKELWDHVLLRDRDSGFCATLTGDVLVTIIFVDDPSSTWTAEEMDAVKATHAAASDIISEHSAPYGTSINLQFLYKQVSLDIELQENHDVAWAGNAMSKAGLNSIFEANLVLEKFRGMEEAPILLYRNTTGRPFAISDSSGSSSEYAIIFNDDVDGSAFLHELYHLFGAVDYYYPSEVEQLAATYYPDSIMYDSTAKSKTDPLTAYLIGWTNTLSKDALQFLQESSQLTFEYMNSENEKEMYTGSVEDYPIQDGIYTGNLVMGEQQGWGKMSWDDGESYEGNWNRGIPHGDGTYTWANGDVYKGQFVNGRFHGQGTLTWVNGDVYTGSFENDEMHGEGTFTWADGTVYVGPFEHNLENGQGVLTWSDGTVYKGKFTDGYMHGRGTITYPDGTQKTGLWQNGSYVSP